MKIACNDQEIRKVLETNYYKIPRFQRPYSWERDNVEEFWTDIISNRSGEYFIGSMVVYEKGDYRHIIDGQQRLTTITILLAVLRDKFLELGLQNQARGTQQLIERPNLDNEQQFVVQTWTSFPFFQQQIQSYEKPKKSAPPGEEEALLKSAHAQLTTLVDAYLLGQATPHKKKLALEKIRNSLLALKIIYVEVDNEDDAYTIFETLNTRGKDLAPSDLLKNHLAKLWKQSNPQNDSIKLGWQTLRETIDRIDLTDVTVDSFLYHHWLGTREFTTERELFKRSKAAVKTKDDCKSLLSELQESATQYLHIFVPSSRHWKKEELPIRRALEALISFRVRQPLPMLLALLSSYNSGHIGRKDVERACRAIETFHFVFTALTSQRSSGGISHMYALHARELTHANDSRTRKNAIDGLVNKLRTRLPAQSSFSSKFGTLKYSDDYPKDKRLIQYVLRRLYDRQNPSVVADHDQMSIEHIEPQSSTTIKPELTASIGNLWLLSISQNNKFGNEAVATKLPKYRALGVVADPILANSTNVWTQQNIKDRANHLEVEMWKIVQEI